MHTLQTSRVRRVQWLDTSARYGLISRVLHWGMAAVLLWQFAAMGLVELFGSTPVSDFMFTVGPHDILGTLVLLLVPIRGAWGLANARRPRRSQGVAGQGAAAVHIVLYVLMLIIPVTALLGNYGRGWGWSFFRFEILPETEIRIEWLAWLGSVAHGRLAWLLLALIAGHVFMALIHHFILKDGTLRRMTD
jgi:cytochrome b561